MRRFIAIFKIKLYEDAVNNDKAVSYLNKIESLLPKYISKLSNKMIRLCKLRINNIQKCRKPLPYSQFKNDGSIIIKAGSFTRIIDNLNHIINLNYKGNHIIQIKNTYKFLMITLNSMSKHNIGNQVGKMELINMITHGVRYSINKNNNSGLARSTINIISDCMVLSLDAYNYYFKLNNVWKMVHNNKQQIKNY